jgi:hypothetical protein
MKVRVLLYKHGNPPIPTGISVDLDQAWEGHTVKYAALGGEAKDDRSENARKLAAIVSSQNVRSISRYQSKQDEIVFMLMKI